jgi:hypothetical protein
MKNKKEFFGVFLSVIICVLIAFAIASATTTISNNITAGGTVAINGSAHSTELSVIGTASISEDLWASGSFQFAGGESTGSLSYSRLGSNTTGHTLLDADDLLITGLLEVDETAYFDSTVVFGDVASANYGLVVDSMLQVGHGASVAYSRFGSGTTGHSLTGANNLLISGNLEIDGTAYFDGLVSVSSANGLLIGGNAKLFGGTASPGGGTLNCTVGSWYFRSGQTASTSLYFCETANEWDQIIGIDKGN